MNKFTTSEALSYGWKKTKEQFWLIAGVLLTYAVISGLLSNWENSPAIKNALILKVIAFAVTLLIGVILRIGMTKFLLNASEGKGQYQDLFSPHDVFFTYFIGYILLSVITVIGFCLLIVPGVIIALMYTFVPILIVDRKMEFMDAFKESAAMTKGSRWQLLGFFIILVSVNIVGAIALVVGLFVTIPMTGFALIYVYRALLNAEMPVTPSAPTEIVPTA